MSSLLRVGALSKKSSSRRRSLVQPGSKSRSASFVAMLARLGRICCWLGTLGSSGTGSTLSQALIGTWKLVSSEFHLSSGDVNHPYGNDAVGLLIYAEDGQMSAQIMRRGRPSFASGDVFGGTPEETKEAMDGVVSYFGSFAVDEAAGTVEHRVVGSVFPNWENETQVRYHELEGTHLTLRTAPLPAGQGITATGVLVWERTGARR